MVIPPVPPKQVWNDIIHPLAIYDANWLPSSHQETSIHISLLERKLNTTKSQFWLRIGSVSVLPHCDEVESELDVLGYISNDVGRLLTPTAKDWVDLQSVRVCVRERQS